MTLHTGSTTGDSRSEETVLALLSLKDDDFLQNAPGRVEWKKNSSTEAILTGTELDLSGGQAGA